MTVEMVLESGLGDKVVAVNEGCLTLMNRNQYLCLAHLVLSVALDVEKRKVDY